MEKIQLIIDTDPGIDDAVALAIALHSERLNVRLITTVAGNVSLDKVTRNALKLLDFFGKDVPVARGANGPLLREAIHAGDIHGDSGMDGYVFPEPSGRQLSSLNAVEAIHAELQACDSKMTLMAIGPLTNIALWLKVYPEDREKVDRLVLMGGALGRGNYGILAEFNIAADPEAAKIVFASGLKIAVASLDVGEEALLFPETNETIRSLNGTGEMLVALFQRYRGTGVRNGLKMYDSCAVAYLLEPEMFTVADVYVDVEIHGALTSGATVVDLNGVLKRAPNATVMVGIDSDRFREWVVESLKRCR